MPRIALGKAIRSVRKAHRLTLADVAERTGSHVGNLSRLERGLAQPSLDLLYRLSRALECPLSELFILASSDPGDAQLIELSAIYRTLNESERKILLDFARLIPNHESIR
ncbi:MULTISPECIES: helix-turn-helix transcriptional regulator [Modicisalibacter]|uniref:helix-turn-helix domain-containing protein n=1 Tax=Modicisalibacter TaxID=574347 RepID=UPI00100A5C3A|nr:MULTISPECIES: helix-turn-helix transcriptional regulator [Halomonadaceae]MBZ9558815.1 helix-turn-helix transcriptional regulator [Modicisalibacter sp. R2A 31.J]MBZ9575294.1 helix-turn-helix transcriptional regulator [Modicisalibacter sp. MOD 31.J]